MDYSTNTKEWVKPTDLLDVAPSISPVAEATEFMPTLNISESPQILMHQEQLSITTVLSSFNALQLNEIYNQ